jgi:hypothetical protein
MYITALAADGGRSWWDGLNVRVDERRERRKQCMDTNLDKE